MKPFDGPQSWEDERQEYRDNQGRSYLRTQESADVAAFCFVLMLAIIVGSLIYEGLERLAAWLR